ncbi:MAG TPA: ester cyclase [Ktedonobacteraceae bacterium]
MAESERVVTRYTVEGTHLGPMMGIAPSGKYGIISGIDMYRITEGRIEEAWSNWDALRLLQEMGVIPPIG